MKPQASEAFAAFVGLDWADAKHDVCLQAAGTAQRQAARQGAAVRNDRQRGVGEGIADTSGRAARGCCS